MNNHEWHVARRWFVGAGLFLLGIITTPYTGIGGMDGGFAIQFVSGFLLLVCLVAGGIYTSRARVLHAILNGHHILADWEYAPGRYPAYSDADLGDDRSSGWALLGVVAFFCVLWGGLFWWWDPDAGPVVALVLAGTIAACWTAFAWNTTWRHRRLAGRYLTRAVVSHEGVYLEPWVYEWRSAGARLDHVELQVSDDGDRLVFGISTKAGSSPRNDYSVRVPVPPGQRSTAERVVSTLSAGGRSRR